jgi:hypothetical protein
MRKTPAKKIPNESQEQQRFVLKLRWFYPDLVFFAIPNGGKRNSGEATRMKLEGVEKGTPDIFIAEPRNGFFGLFIEMKKKRDGSISEAQKGKIKLLREKGYAAHVCYGAEQAIEVLNSYLDDSNSQQFA